MKDYPDHQPADHRQNRGRRPFHALRAQRETGTQLGVPRQSGLEHRVGGLEKDCVKGCISHDPANHQKMTAARVAKIAKVADDIPAPNRMGRCGRRPARRGLGRHARPPAKCRGRDACEGKKVSLCHFNYINPLPHGVADIFALQVPQDRGLRAERRSVRQLPARKLQQFATNSTTSAKACRSRCRAQTSFTLTEVTMADYKYTPADFKSDQEVRWCPGCGDHAILSAVQRALPEIADQLDTPHNLFTFISGIGCSSRFIYYMKTYGFHSVHGRANAVATGVKVANPRLNVWVTSGDGDSLAIGGNHFIHAIRRNMDLNAILFNNEIYGLTKGSTRPLRSWAKSPRPRPTERSRSRSTPANWSSAPKARSSPARSTWRSPSRKNA